MWSLLTFFPEHLLINILDIGAAMIQEPPPYQSLLDSGRAKLIGFEPDIEKCLELQELYGEPHQFFPYFVSDGQDATFYETNSVYTGSLYEPNAGLLDKFHQLGELTTLVATYPVETIKLDDLTEITEVDFFKIDVQGCELNIFQNSKRILQNTLVIRTEVEFVELYKKQPLFSDVDTFLRSQGFQFLRFVGFGTRNFKPLAINNNPYTGNQMIWADALYIRDWMNLDQLSELQLKKYAVVAHDILGFCDLCHLILSALDRKSDTHFAQRYIECLTSNQ